MLDGNNRAKRAFWGRAAISRRPDFAQVYREQFDFVRRTLRRMGVSAASVDDGAQDVFVVIHRRLPDYEPRAPLRAWVFQIVRRVAFKYRRRAGREAPRNLDLGQIPDTASLERAIQRAQAREILVAFLESLDEDKRAAYVLCELEGLTGGEAAMMLDANPNTVAARLRAARKQLDQLVQRLRVRDQTLDLPSVPRLLELGQTEDEMSDERRAGAWMLLTARLAEEGVALAPVSGSAVGLGLAVKAGTLATVIAAVASAVLLGDLPGTESGTAADPRVSSTGPTTSESSRATLPPETTLSPPAATPPKPRTMVNVPVQSVAPRIQPSASKSRIEPRNHDPLGAETKLLADARAALVAGVAPEALRLLRRHANHFPNGHLTKVAATMRVEALCSAGRTQESREAARRFVSRWPDSRYATSMESVCAARESQ